MTKEKALRIIDENRPFDDIEIFYVVIPQINDFDTLISYRRYISRKEIYSLEKRLAMDLVEKRMTEVLPDILSKTNDFDKLIYYFRSTSGEAEGLILKRMIEVLPVILPQINDFDKLIYYFRSTSGEARDLVKKRIKEV